MQNAILPTMIAQTLTKLHPHTPLPLHQLALTQTESEFLTTLHQLPQSEIPLTHIGNTLNITLAHIAAIRDWPLVLTWLSHHRVPLNAADHSGSTPLHLASTSGLFHLLIRLGADPYLQDHQGRSAASLSYLNGWAQFPPPATFPNSRRYYPFPQWAFDTRLRQWLQELNLSPLPSSSSSSSSSSYPELNAFLDAHLRAQLPAFIQALSHHQAPIWEARQDPRLPVTTQWTLHLTAEVQAGDLIALYVGRLGHLGLDSPQDIAYTFIQNDTFVDATRQGSGAELINDSFPNLTSFNLDHDGIPLTALVATQDLPKGSGLFYCYGRNHPIKTHIELNPDAKAAWLALHLSPPTLPLEPAPHHYFEWLDYLTKSDYLTMRNKA